MRIAIVHSYYSSRQPSGENIVVDLQIDALRAAGHDVQIFGYHSDSKAESPTQTARSALRVATGMGRNPGAEIARFAPDVLHVHNLFPNFAQRWLLDWRGPIVATVHNYRSVCAAGSMFREGQGCVSCAVRGSQESIRHRCYRDSRLATLPLAIATRSQGLHNAVVRRADRLVFLSPRARVKLASALSIEVNGRAVVIPNFADAPKGTLRASARKEVWVYSGRLAPEKGAYELAACWDSGDHLFIVGDGPDRHRIAQIANGRNIHLLGAVPFAEAGKLIGDAKGLIFPSLWEEPAPAMSYLQALSAGVPTLSIAGNAVADDIAEYGTGIVANNMHELRAIIRAGIATDAYEVSATRRFETAFSRSVWVDRMVRLYQEVTS